MKVYNSQNELLSTWFDSGGPINVIKWSNDGKYEVYGKMYNLLYRLIDIIDLLKFVILNLLISKDRYDNTTTML